MAGYIGTQAVSVNTTSATITGDASIGGNVTLNDGSADVDFRVESDDETHAIFVNGGDDVVNFFTTTTVNASSGTVGPDGVSHYADGRTDMSRASAQPLNLRRRTNDGVILNFYKEASGTTANIGAIGVDGGSLAIGGGDVGIGFYQGADAIVPYTGVTDLRDSAIDLGLASTGRWKDLHLAGNVIVATAGKGIDFAAVTHLTQPSGGSVNELLDRYEEGTYSPVLTGAGSGTDAGTGSYVIVGKLITVSVTFNNIGTGLAGNLSVNLPATANPQGAIDMYLPVQWYDLDWNSAAKAQYGYISDGSATLVPYYSKDAAASAIVQGDELKSSTYLRFTITYQIT